MILFQGVIEILYGAVLAILRKGTFGFELNDGRRISSVLVGVDDSRLGMVRACQNFS
jgi:hypothetical protein